MFYTWKSCFAKNIHNIKITNLIKHSINLVSDAQSVIGKVPKYIIAKHAFANEIFLQIEDTGIIIYQSSLWGIKIKFLLKKRVL